MNIIGLSGNLWPVHLKPLPDELLSSWLIRLAHGHGLKLQTFCALVFGSNKSIWTRDIDKLAPDWLTTKLSLATGASLKEVYETTLHSYEAILYEHHQPNGNTRWLVPLGIFHRTRKRPGLMFCPQCLREDPMPYFRKSWRLAYSIVCTKHECYLLDGCPECKSPLAPHRTDMQGRENLLSASLDARCWKCGFDLRKSLQSSKPDDSLLRLQVYLEQIQQHGYADWADNSSMHSVIFFNGLRALIVGITSQETRKRLKNSPKFNCVNFKDWPRSGFEMTSLSQRRVLFCWLTSILERWPENFINLIHEHRLRYSDLKGDSEQRSFWYEDAIRHEAGGGYAPISQEEAGAIASYVETAHGRFSGVVARNLSGRDIYAHVSERLAQPVSDEVYKELLTSIDHQIAGTLDKKERVCLIRDKVMFATGRQLGLSEGALANLTLDQVRVLVPEEVAADFSEVAGTPAQARAWVEWYWEKMRPQLRPQSNIDCVFTSSKTRRGFRHSAVGRRFQKIVGAGMMLRSVPSYGCWAIPFPRVKS